MEEGAGARDRKNFISWRWVARKSLPNGSRKPNGSLATKKLPGRGLTGPTRTCSCRRPIDEIEAGGEALVAMILDRLEPPEEDPYA